MFITPDKLSEIIPSSKRKYEDLSNEKCDESCPLPIKDTLILKDEEPSKRRIIDFTSSAEPELSPPKRTGQKNLNLGPTKDHFHKLCYLIRAFKKDFFPYNKPLAFLRNDESTVFVLSRPYLTDWKSEANAAEFHNRKPPRDINLIAGYVRPTNNTVTEIGPIAPHFSGNNEKCHLASILLLPGGDSNLIENEVELTILAQCMYCFDVGLDVVKNQEIARSLEISSQGKDVSYGIHMAMHHASANNDYDEAMYFFSKGGNPRVIWDGNHEHSLDMAVHNNNGPLVSQFLSRFTSKDIRYIRYLLENKGYDELDMIDIIKSKLVELESVYIIS